MVLAMLTTGALSLMFVGTSIRSPRAGGIARPAARVLAEATVAPPALVVPPARISNLMDVAETLTARRRRRSETLGARLLASTLRWGVEHAGDGAILALTSPGTFRMMSDWQRTCYGEVSQLATHLEAEALKLARHVEFSCGVAGARVEHRAKGLLSTFTKVVSRGKDQPRDILGLRLVLPDGDDDACYAAMRAVHRLWQPAPHCFKDYIASPKANGYQSLHETVRLADGRLMEVQIRSASMHEQAERGSAAHKTYKSSSMKWANVIGGLVVA